MVARLSKALNFAPHIYKPRMERGWSYEFISGASALCIFDLIKLTREVLPQINVPLLGCFSKKDWLTRGTATTLALNVDKAFLNIQWFNQSGHIMPLGVQLRNN